MGIAVSTTLRIGVALSVLCVANTAAMVQRPAPGRIKPLHLTMIYDGDPMVCQPVKELVGRAINRYAGTPDISHYDDDQVFSSHYARYRPPQIVVPKPDIPGADKPFDPVGGTQQEAFRLNTGEGVGGGSIVLIMHEFWHGVYYANVYILKKDAVIPPVGNEPSSKDIIFALGQRKYSGERMPYLLTKIADLSKYHHLKNNAERYRIYYSMHTGELFLDNVYTASLFLIKNLHQTFLFLGNPRYSNSIVLKIEKNNAVDDICYFRSK